VEKSNGGKRRVRRLVLAGILWTWVLLVGAPALAALVFGLESPDWAEASEVESGIDSRLGHAAAGLSGVDVAVWCWSSEDWKKRTAGLARRYKMERLGPWRAYTAVNRSAIHLSPEICAGLRSLAEPEVPIPDDGPRDRRAWSLFGLAHEAYHALGISDEAVATCYGMQSMEKAARLLGRSAAEGRRLAMLFSKHWYPGLGSEYRLDGCRNGGELDLHPETDVWP
jgi:hypothetical protein